MNEILIDKLPAHLKAENRITHSALELAGDKARRAGTPLVIKENGNIREIAASSLKRWIAKQG